MRTAALNPKAKEIILNAAQKLILAQGYEATSVDEICAKAKLTKGSFFHYFKSKKDLVKKLLERFCCDSFKSMQEGCCCECATDDPLKRVYAHVDFAIKRVKGPMADAGCLLGMLSQEMSDKHPEIRSICEKGFDAWAKMFKKDLAAAKAKYGLKADVSIDSLAEHFIAVIEGSLILAKVKRDKKIVERNLIHFRQYLKALFKK